MKRTTRGEQILNRLVNDPRCELTPEGKNWLIQVLDPNHDRPFVKTGWPSQNTRPSLVRQVKQSMSISSAANGGPALTQPWDLHVAWVPLINVRQFTEVGNRINNVASVNMAGTSYPFGGLMARRVITSGGDVDWIVSTSDPDNLGTLSIDDQYLSGYTRLVGVGFEVTDTSAEINKQGSLCVYSYPQELDDEVINVLDTSALPGFIKLMSVGANRLVMPPYNLKQAMLLPDSKIWEAKYGAYCVPTFQDLQNPAMMPSSKVVYLEWPDTLVRTDSSLTTDVYYPTATTGLSVSDGQSPATNLTILAPPLFKVAPTNTHGVILSGLNPNSTFIVSLTYYLETIPSISDPALVVLTQPPPPFDPCALEIYTRVVERLPPGVMVGDNDSGEWFWNIVADVADVVGPALNLVPEIGPFLSTGAAAIGKGARSTANNKTEAAKAKKKKKKAKLQVQQQTSRGTMIKSNPGPTVQKGLGKKPLPPIPKRRGG